MDKQKSNIVEALAKKGIALAKTGVLDNNIKDRLEELDNIYTEIMKFSEATDAKALLYSVWHAYAHAQYGRMYKYLQKHFEDKRQRDNLEELSHVAAALNYDHLQTVVKRMTVTAYPNSYRLF